MEIGYYTKHKNCGRTWQIFQELHAYVLAIFQFPHFFRLASSTKSAKTTDNSVFSECFMARVSLNLLAHKFKRTIPCVATKTFYTFHRIYFSSNDNYELIGAHYLIGFSSANRLISTEFVTFCNMRHISGRKCYVVQHYNVNLTHIGNLNLAFS